ncbi:hypothetical protein ACQUSR_17450 [Streptomyces sp. P1-3]|uniref:hypothetical protein n=1 Tax=Streptomyces sp. P1-3 TaxID=3421658 RepID=UPI003D36B36B
MASKTKARKARRALRWMYGSVPRGLIFSFIFVLLLGLGYLRLMNAIGGKPSHGCPRPASDVSVSALDGEYTGPDGMRIRLAYHRSGPDSGVNLWVENWRYSGYEHGDDSLGSFDGSGYWDYEPRSGVDGMQIRLSFTEGPEGNPDPISFLTVGGDSEHPVLFDDVDPDVCPDIVLTKAD